MLTTYFLHVAGVYFIYKACVLQISTMETINQDVVYKNAGFVESCNFLSVLTYLYAVMFN